jgi:hypothetical protein
VRRASRFLPGPAEERYREEWLAELEVLPGHGVTAIIFALRVFLRALTVAREITGQTTPKRAQFALRDGFDRLFAALLLFVFAPVMLLAIIAVKVSRGGPRLKFYWALAFSPEVNSQADVTANRLQANIGPKLVGKFVSVAAEGISFSNLVTALRHIYHITEAIRAIE